MSKINLDVFNATLATMEAMDELLLEREAKNRALNADQYREAVKERIRQVILQQGGAVDENLIAEAIKKVEGDMHRFVPPQRGIWHLLAIAYVRLRTIALKRPLTYAIALLGYVTIVAFGYIELSKVLEAGEGRTSSQQIGTGTLPAEAQNTAIELRAVKREGVYSAFWRFNNSSPDAKKFYATVEALDSAGNPVALKFTDAETGKVLTQSTFGIQLSEADYHRVGQGLTKLGAMQNGKTEWYIDAVSNSMIGAGWQK